MSGIEPNFALHPVPNREAASESGLRPAPGCDPFGIFWAKTLPMKADFGSMTGSDAACQDDSVTIVDVLPVVTRPHDEVPPSPRTDQANADVISEENTENATVLPKAGEHTATTLAWLVGQSAVAERSETAEISSTTAGHSPNLYVPVGKALASRSPVVLGPEVDVPGMGGDPVGIFPQLKRQPTALVPAGEPTTGDVISELSRVRTAAESVAIQGSLPPTEKDSSINRGLVLLGSFLTVLNVPDEASGQVFKSAFKDKNIADPVFYLNGPVPVFDDMNIQKFYENDIIFPSVKEYPVTPSPLEFQSVIGESQATFRFGNLKSFASNVVQSLIQENLNSFDLKVQQDTARSGLSFSLQHKDLGNISFTFKNNDIGISVYLGADRADTLDMLRRNISVLNAALKDGGFENISFSFGDGGSSTSSNQGRARFFDLREISEAPEPAMVDHTVNHPVIDNGTVIDCRY